MALHATADLILPMGAHNCQVRDCAGRRPCHTSAKRHERASIASDMATTPDFDASAAPPRAMLLSAAAPIPLHEGTTTSDLWRAHVRATATMRGVNSDPTALTAAIRTHAHVNAVMGKLQVSRDRATSFAQHALRMFGLLQRRLGPAQARVPAAELRLLGAESLVHYAGCHEVVATFDNDDPNVYQQAISALQVRGSAALCSLGRRSGS
jgi:hypothetical protein